jgi:hypothetical protein
LITIFVFVCNVHPLKNMQLLIKQGGASYRGELQKALAVIPSSSRVLIPVAFWEAALLQGKTSTTEYRFSTFPNILEAEPRRHYEDKLSGTLESGDILIWDPKQELGGIFNFVTATALRHVILQPDQPGTGWTRLQSIHIPSIYSQSQAEEFMVYRKN